MRVSFARSGERGYQVSDLGPLLRKLFLVLAGALVPAARVIAASDGDEELPHRHSLFQRKGRSLRKTDLLQRVFGAELRDDEKRFGRHFSFELGPVAASIARLRRPRCASGGFAYGVRNRAADRASLFDKGSDYATFK
ncbi:MAG: hypothetical protein HY040_17670 [Planctomycetes bacterium]|nr:hypothetical protein [Planctomycetota bacterium]